MPTLLMRFSAPMQAWGIRSRFTERDTGGEPSKSGVLGVLCCALGKAKRETADSIPLADLAALRMGVRADHEGVLRKDYHTAGGGNWGASSYGVYKADGKKGDTVLSNRFYLADAHFLIGLEGDLGILERLSEAIHHPVWQICFGRKAFVPALPIHLPESAPEGPGVLADTFLEGALLSAPLGSPLEPRSGALPKQVRFVVDAQLGDDTPDVRMDVPLDFESRLFASRRVKTYFEETGAIRQR